MTKKHKMISIAAIVLVIAVGASFFGGMKFAEAKTRGGTQRGQFAGMMTADGQARSGQQGMTGGMRTSFGGATAGEVIAKDDTSVTVKLSDGGSKIIFYTPSTPVTKNASASIADVTVGEQVQVTGKANPDGSVSAQSIRIGGMMMTAPAAR